MRVWVTCSEDVQERACDAIRDYGGSPISLPLIRLTSVDVRIDWQAYDWLVLTSPAAVRCLLDQGTCKAMWKTDARECVPPVPPMEGGNPLPPAGGRRSQVGIDLRVLPKILCCGPGTARALQRVHLLPDAQPVGSYSTAGVLQEATKSIAPGAKVLRVRSDRAGDGLAVALREAGFQVDDLVISRNECIRVEHPQCEAVFFASASAVDAYFAQYGKECLVDKVIGIMGHREAERLTAEGIRDVRIPKVFTLDGAIATMAGVFVEGGRRS